MNLYLFALTKIVIVSVDIASAIAQNPGFEKAPALQSLSHLLTSRFGRHDKARF